MDNTRLIGIDLAKNVFHLHGVDQAGNQTITRKLTRNQLKAYLLKLKPTIVAMEACASSHYWGRLCREYGHEIRLISPQFVKPFVKSNKNDRNDAKAICEAANRPEMNFVPVKTTEQQSIMSLHRIRELLISQRTATINQLRGLLGEFGLTAGVGRKTLYREFAVLFESLQDKAAGVLVQGVQLQWKHLEQLEEQINTLTKTIQDHANQCEHTRRLQTIPGLGPLGASALFTQVGDAKQFKNGRQMAAWLGLVPRQHSTGGKSKLLGISKRGDSYTRKLIIHGARAVIRHCTTQNPTNALRHSVLHWISKKHTNVSITALANRNVRIAWAVLVNKRDYDVKFRSELASQFTPA